MTAVRVLPIEASTYARHGLHRSERIWSETNCYVDVWIEVLHALGLEPLAAASFALAVDFEVDQWTFFKYPPEDLRTVYGIRVQESNPWRGVLDHVLDQLGSGRLCTVEVDSWYLPDTAGVSYRIQHDKTTIVPNDVDPDARRLGYFHGASYYELEGEDFDGALRTADPSDALAPYVETVRLDRMEALPTDDLVQRARELLRHHVAELPEDNPVLRFRARYEEDVAWLRDAGADGFHRWAFGAVRQLGASAEVGAAHLRWLRDAGGDTELGDPADTLTELAEESKAFQFQVARVARGRDVDARPSLERMATTWDAVRSGLERHVG